MPDKKELRTNCIQVRKSLTPGERAEKSAEICKKLEESDVFKKAGHILFYYANEWEVDTIPLIKKWSLKKQVYLPKLRGENEFVALPMGAFDQLRKGLYGIYEPEDMDHERFEKEIDLIIVPGVAFDKECNRMGMGKGFYDRYLGRFQDVPKVALAFEEQMLDSVPKEKYDKPVDFVITDKNIYLRNAK